ncbi:MAG: TMEM175 family protein [Nitrososphaeraceae archaeon]
MKLFLQIQKIKTLSDSVLLVGIVLLVYNLASLAATKLYDFDPETFLNTLVAYINSFIVVFLYWSIVSIILSYLKQLNVTIFFLLISILILVTLVPVAHEALLQLKKPTAFYFASITFITPGILLIALSLYAGYKGELRNVNLYRLIADSSVIPGVYGLHFVFAIYNPILLNFIPFSIFPILYILDKILRDHYR